MAYGADVIANKSTALAGAITTVPQAVIFNGITSNINNAYSGTTGIYTTPVADTYEINASMQFIFPTAVTATGSTVCMSILRAGVQVSESCEGDSNDTA